MAGLSSKQELPCRVLDRYGHGDTFRPLNSHSDICELPGKLIVNWVLSNNTVYKQHIAPTANNTEAVLSAGARLLVLWRDPQSSLMSYCRRRVSENGPWTGEKAVALLHARFVALSAWVDAWQAVAATHPKLISIFSFEEMESSGRKAVLEKELLWLGLPQLKAYNEEHRRNHDDIEVCKPHLLPATIVRPALTQSDLARRTQEDGCDDLVQKAVDMDVTHQGSLLPSGFPAELPFELEAKVDFDDD